MTTNAKPAQQLDADCAAMLVLQTNPKDQAAFAGIYTRWYEKLRKRARYLTGADDAAEEATQAAFVKVFSERDGFEVAAGDGFSRWIYTILKYAAYGERYARRKVKRNLHALDKRKKGVADKEAPTTDFETEVEEAKEILNGLDPALKEIWELRAIDGLKWKDIAARLQVPLMTARYRFDMAEKALRDGHAKEK